MFNKLFTALGNVCSLQNVIGDITEMLEDMAHAYGHDNSAHNAAIDAIVEILQAHKVAVAPAPAAVITMPAGSVV